MAATVSLEDIVDALDALHDEFTPFLDLETGEVETVSRELLLEAEEGDEDDEDGVESIPEWQRPEWEIATLIGVKSPERFERLPNSFEVHQWNIMREFAEQFPSAPVRSELLDAIHGSGAFRAFKIALRRLRVEANWFEFRHAALRQIAIEWCEQNHVSWK